MRHFVSNAEPLPPGLIDRLVEAAHLAPSVGYMQPWRFIRITNRALREQMHSLVEAEKQATAQALMPEREKHIVGRRMLPEMGVASVGYAIQNM